MAFNSIEIERVVLKFFIRELKDRNLLHLMYGGNGVKDKIFQMFRNTTNKKSVLRSRDQMRESPFNGCNTFDSMINILEKLNKETIYHHKQQLDEGGIITMTINHLIHFFIEQEFMKRNAMQDLNDVGQSIFNRVVGVLYGQNRIQEFNNRSNECILPNEIKQQLWNAYMKGCGDGSINISFDAFVAQKLNEMVMLSTKHAPQMGIFGNTPEDEEYFEDDDESEFLFEDEDENVEYDEHEQLAHEEFSNIFE